MNLYIVDVDCWYLARLKTDKHRPERPEKCEARTFIVEAESVAQARAVGVKLADETAACGEEWLRFECHQARRLDLPREIRRDTIFDKPTTFSSLLRTA